MCHCWRKVSISVGSNLQAPFPFLCVLEMGLRLTGWTDVSDPYGMKSICVASVLGWTLIVLPPTSLPVCQLWKYQSNSWVIDSILLQKPIQALIQKSFMKELVWTLPCSKLCAYCPLLFPSVLCSCVSKIENGQMRCSMLHCSFVQIWPVLHKALVTYEAVVTTKFPEWLETCSKLINPSAILKLEQLRTFCRWASQTGTPTGREQPHAILCTSLLSCDRANSTPTCSRSSESETSILHN